MLDPASETGELGRINRVASDEFYRVERVDLYACIKLALDYGKESGGAYDPTAGVLRRLYETRLAAANPPRPTEIDVALTRVGWEKVTVEPESTAVRFRTPGLQLDLGTVAHGCAVDWASRTFARSGSLGGLIRVGGVYRAWESPVDEEAWRISLRDPRREDDESCSRSRSATGVWPSAASPKSGRRAAEPSSLGCPRSIRATGSPWAATCSPW